jgi:hypothetical protein
MPALGLWFENWPSKGGISGLPTVLAGRSAMMFLTRCKACRALGITEQRKETMVLRPTCSLAISFDRIGGKLPDKAA